MRQRVAPVIFGGPMLVYQGFFFLGAVVVLILLSFWTIKDFRIEPIYQFGNWQAMLSSRLFWEVYLDTLGYAAIAAVAAVLIGFPFAYAIAFKFSAHSRRILMMVMIVPFFTSYLVRSYAWNFTLAVEGPLNFLLNTIGLPSVKLFGTLTAMEIGYLTYSFPLVALFLLLSLINVDRDLIEAAHNLGAKRLKTVWLVIVPSIRIGLVFAAAFAFVLAVGDFVAPMMLGASNQMTLSLLITGATKAGGDFPRAAVIAVMILVTLMAVLFVAFRFAFPPSREARK